MGIITTIKRWVGMLFGNKAKEEFNVTSIINPKMDAYIDKCMKIYRGHAPWINPEDNIKSINFAKTVSSEVARLTTLGIKITLDGSARAEWLQKQIDNIYYQLRDWVEYATAYGTIVLKPNGESIDLVLPNDFIVTSQKNGNIDGAVFVDTAKSIDNKKFYTRLEYHRFENGQYIITNKCYVGDTQNSADRYIDINDTPWNGMLEEAYIDNIEQPLFAVLKMPSANNIDENSPFGMPIFSEGLQEMEDLDIAYSRNAEEIFNSARTVLLDSDRLIPQRGQVMTANGWERAKKTMGLPRYVKNVLGDGTTDFYQEINPSLNTEERLKGLNALLSQLGFKCGFSNGYFVFNEKTGMITATQVEADDRRTIQLIKDARDQLEKCIGSLVYALDKFADLYNYAPVGVYEVVYSFGDITYNYEEDKQNWWKYVQSGKMPMWRYLVKFEGMSEEEAKEIGEEMKQKEVGLFDE